MQEYMKELRESYLRYCNTNPSRTLLMSSGLFNMPYRVVDEQAVRSFMSLYIRQFHSAYSTLHSQPVSSTTVEEFNSALKEAANHNTKVEEAIHETLVLYSNHLKKIGEKIYYSQHPSEAKSLKSSSSSKDPGIIGSILEGIGDFFSGLNL